ncbi:DNA-binding transcriptional regulator, LysR family [Pseudonocardia ammonioxydans]|uniref:DNA-binding transcriptional regulator, LysR family n=1 Tax=Pseudonocardia ammonioxydans TaxID=260086 RepID=A0A1I5B465_PSUAM|nr:LysR substrate-binding domain-containing protein [Pseudonocardia ammonioxydans]SFN69504.1 DNA-binding transcriptional regulator, LysR family [Pseudonocardia ammonioxydans]
MTTTARLRAFVALAEQGSVRGAAARLVVTESTVSAAVRALADEVGVALVERDGRGVRLTPAGQRYAGYARRVLGLLEEGTAAARGEADPEHGRIRLAAVTTAGEHLLPELLAGFRERHPGVVLEVDVAPSDRVWPMLAHHEVDVVVAGRPPATAAAPGTAGPPPVRAVRDNTLVVVAGPGTSADPARATWLLREPGSGTRATQEALLGDIGVDPPRLLLGSHGATVAAARAGLGITLVSREAVRRLLAAGELVELDVPGTPLQRPWHLVTHPDATASTELLLAHVLATSPWHRP